MDDRRKSAERLPPDRPDLRRAAGGLDSLRETAGELKGLLAGPIHRGEVLSQRQDAHRRVDQLPVERRDPVQGREAFDVRLHRRREDIPRRLDLRDREVLRPLLASPPLRGRRLRRPPECLVEKALRIEDPRWLEHGERRASADKAYRNRKRAASPMVT